MPERIDWLDDGSASGSPYSPRFGDRYHGESGGVEQARNVFLNGCDLPRAWAGQPHWRVLETGFGLGLNFLVTWAAWKADPQRPRMLHFVSTEAFAAGASDVLRSVQGQADLLPLAQQLERQWWGLLPGFHRLVFEGGRVLLTLCIGDARAMLRGCAFAADSVYLDGFDPRRNPYIWNVATFKALAGCCRRGTRVATWTVARSVRDALAQCGFAMKKVAGMPPKRDNLRGEYHPPWTLSKPPAIAERRIAARCIVIGAGLAGAAVASSLARRGWQVAVLDAGQTPATGASALPAGIMAPHVSPDDNPLARLTRAGIRATLRQAERLLMAGEDWSPTGVLEHCVLHPRKLPADWHAGKPLAEAASEWTREASTEERAACGLPPDGRALWHQRAGWVKPASLVRAWLATPGVAWRGNARVDSLTRQSGVWQALDAAGEELASGELLVLAAGHASPALARMAGVGWPLALQSIRGQVSWAMHQPTLAGTYSPLPAFPVNGNGGLIPSFPIGDCRAWLMGSSFVRDDSGTDLRRADEQGNLDKLRTLLPLASQALSDRAGSDEIRGWAGVRAVTPTRLPALGPLDSSDPPELWLCGGMGSRGLTFAALCAELLAARLHGEPLPVEARLADALLPLGFAVRACSRYFQEREPGENRANQGVRRRADSSPP